MSSSPSIARPLTDRQLSGFRARLEQDLAEAHELESRLRAEIVASLESRRSTPTDESEDPEGSSLAFEGAQSSAMLQQTTAHAIEIAGALERVAAGSYGTCLECGGQIAAGRLDARPSSAYCIDCAS